MEGTKTLNKPVLTIDLDNRSGVYETGESLKGVVHLQLQEQITITGIVVHFYGDAHVRWLERRQKDDDDKNSIEHTAQENYIDETLVLWGHSPKESQSVEILTKGTHMFPFKFVIPRDVPCSFEGLCGWIRYFLKCTVYKKDEPKEMSSKVVLSISQPLDGAGELSRKNSIKEKKDSYTRTTCFKAGKISCMMCMARPVYVPGESLHVEIDVNNMSSVKIKSTSLQLKQITRYGSTSGKVKSVVNDISCIQGDCVKPKRRQCWTSSKIVLPCLPPSRLDGCQYIDVHYELVLHLNIPSNPTIVSAPVTIATIPTSRDILQAWTYAEQYIGKRSLSKSASMSSLTIDKVHDIPDSQFPFHPKYKLYKVGKPLMQMCTLTKSPGEKRRQSLYSRSYSIFPHNYQESVV